jgi:hypothetical protein
MFQQTQTIYWYGKMTSHWGDMQSSLKYYRVVIEAVLYLTCFMPALINSSVVILIAERQENNPKPGTDNPH